MPSVVAAVPPLVPAAVAPAPGFASGLSGGIMLSCSPVAPLRCEAAVVGASACAGGDAPSVTVPARPAPHSVARARMAVRDSRLGEDMGRLRWLVPMGMA